MYVCTRIRKKKTRWHLHPPHIDIVNCIENKTQIVSMLLNRARGCNSRYTVSNSNTKVVQIRISNSFIPSTRKNIYVFTLEIQCKRVYSLYINIKKCKRLGIILCNFSDKIHCLRMLYICISMYVVIIKHL